MLTDEGLLHDVMHHPVLTGKQKSCFSSLSDEEEEALRRANALIKRVTRGRKSGEIYRAVSTANFGHDRNMKEIRGVCTPEIVARLGNGKLKADDIVLDCKCVNII